MTYEKKHDIYKISYDKYSVGLNKLHNYYKNGCCADTIDFCDVDLYS